jgi:hypothetical protein
MMRLLNICVIAALVAAAGHVYKIKFESTRQAERVAKLRMEIRREHDLIAALRAEWSKLDNPLRLQELAKRHTLLKPVEVRQFDKLDQLPERPPALVPPDNSDPIGFLLEKPDTAEPPTASVPTRVPAAAAPKTVVPPARVPAAGAPKTVAPAPRGPAVAAAPKAAPIPPAPKSGLPPAPMSPAAMPVAGAPPPLGTRK